MMNVHENIAFGLRRRGEKGPGVDKKVRELLERVGLPESGKKTDQPTLGWAETTHRHCTLPDHGTNGALAR